MSLPLPNTALTPVGRRPILDPSTPNPLIKGKMGELDEFFQNAKPVQWLPEVYAAQNGGDTKGFVEGLRTMSTWKRFKLRTSMAKLLNYCESERGQNQRNLLLSCSFLDVASDDLAVNIGARSVESYKDKVQSGSGYSYSSLSSAHLHTQHHHAGEVYGEDDFDNLLFLPKTGPSTDQVPYPSDTEEHELTTAQRICRSTDKIPARSKEALQETSDVAVKGTETDNLEPLKRRAKEHATNGKDVKARKTNKGVQRIERSIELLKQRRTERFRLLDSSRFWKLKSSGREVEKVLFSATLRHGAPISIRSYTIDLSCPTTKSLFSEKEWREITKQRSFDLPELSHSTARYLERLRKCMMNGHHPYSIPTPQVLTTSKDELHDLYLATRTAAEWHFLYNKTPSPFVVEDLSEAWWGRVAWPVWLDLLNDVDGMYMIDGEKSGIESSRRRNQDREQSTEEGSRKRTGKKLDLICRDEIQKCDWMVVERMRKWDKHSTKFLKEMDHVVLRETVTIAHNRMNEVLPVFRKTCRFFGGYTGGQGYTTIQLRPANSSSYVLLMQRSPMYVLATQMDGLRFQFQGLVRILQIRAEMRKTIEVYRELQKAKEDEDDQEDLDEEDSLVEEDMSWMYEDPVADFNCNLILASSPLAVSPNASGMDDDLDDEDE